MRYTERNVTLDISISDGDYTGNCGFYIPAKHVKFMIDNCGMEVNKDYHGWGNPDSPMFFHQYGEIWYNKETRKYYCTSPDLLIMYLAWLLEQDGSQEMEVEYANAFWAIHDFQHAIHDEAGCTIYVDQYVEKQRLDAAFVLMKEAGHEITYEILQEVAEAYNGRFGTNESFEEHFEFDEEYEEEEEEDYEYA